MRSPRFQKRDILTVSLLVTALILAFLSGFYGRALLDSQSGDLAILKEARGLLQQNALNPLPAPTRLEYGMIRGMLEAYNDPYTLLLDPPQAELQSDQLQGHFGGIGVRIEQDAQGNYLLFPYPDSPAQKAGIRESDRLLKVDDLEITPASDSAAVQAALRGPVGQSVAVMIGRAPDYAPQVISAKRQDVPLPSVTWNLSTLDGRVGVIQVNIIAATTPDEIKQAIADLQSRGATHFILDLRNNGGGLLATGVDVARLFLKDGEVIQQQYKDKPVETFNVETPGPYADLPLVILINHNTASAAEIVAGSLQTRGRAELVGSPSYGKDTIQLIFDLQGGGSLHITAAKWWIPGYQGQLEGKGLQPDVSIPDDQGDAAIMQAAVQTLLK